MGDCSGCGGCSSTIEKGINTVEDMRIVMRYLNPEGARAGQLEIKDEVICASLANGYGSQSKENVKDNEILRDWYAYANSTPEALHRVANYLRDSVEPYLENKGTFDAMSDGINSSIFDVIDLIEELKTIDEWGTKHTRIDINLHDALYKLRTAKKELER